MVAVLCNALIIHVVRVNLNMRTTTNYLIANMAIGDSIATITSSIATLAVLSNKPVLIKNAIFTEYFQCRGIYALYFISMVCSIYSLVVITFDRFMAVTRPLKYKYLCSWTKYTIPLIWLISFVIPAHYIINIEFCEKADGKYYCFAGKSPFDAALIFSIGFALPHVVILGLYLIIAYKLWTRKVPGENAPEVNAQSSSQKVAKKVTRMIVSILVAFEISWCPVFLGYILPFLREGPEMVKGVPVILYKLLMISNGISNALIYAVFNENFRRALKGTLVKIPLVAPVGNLLIKGNRPNQRMTRPQDDTSTSSIPTKTEAKK